MDGNFCAYLRKSRADEVREKLEDNYDALAHHRLALQDLAERMDVEIKHWYSDGIKSGESIINRDGMQALLEDIQDGLWSGVLVVEVERLTRGGLADQATVLQAFSDTSTLIITPMKVYDPDSEADMEYFEFGMFMSRREFKTINKRLIAGRVASVKEGQYICKDAPYGYDKAVIDGMKTLVPNDDAEGVRLVFELYIKGVSYRNIAKQLDLLGYKPLRGRKWHPASVRNFISNPIYIGKVRWNTQKQEVYYENGRRRYRIIKNDNPLICDGLHEAIIDDELWAAAQMRVDAAPVRGQYEIRNHYGRILKCADCGRALTYKPSSHGTEPLLVHLNRGEDCPNKGVRLSVLDNVIVKALESIIQGIDTTRPDNEVDHSAFIKQYEEEAARCEKTIKDNLDRLERGILTEEEYIERKQELSDKAKQCRKAAEELRCSTASLAMTHRKTIRDVINIIQDPDAPTDAKRKLIWGLIDHIEYQNIAVQGHDNIKLHIHMRSGREHEPAISLVCTYSRPEKDSCNPPS